MRQCDTPTSPLLLNGGGAVAAGDCVPSPVVPSARSSASDVDIRKTACGVIVHRITGELASKRRMVKSRGKGDRSKG